MNIFCAGFDAFGEVVNEVTTGAKVASVSTQADHLQHLGHDALDRPRRLVDDLEGEGHVLGDRQLIQQHRRLEHHRHRATLDGDLRHVRPAHQHPAARALRVLQPQLEARMARRARVEARARGLPRPCARDDAGLEGTFVLQLVSSPLAQRKTFACAEAARLLISQGYRQS